MNEDVTGPTTVTSVRSRRLVARPSGELSVALLPTPDGVTLSVNGPVERATFPLLRAALLTAAAGLESLLVDLRRATVDGDDCWVLLAVLERRMRRFGRSLRVVEPEAGLHGRRRRSGVGTTFGCSSAVPR